MFGVSVGSSDNYNRELARLVERILENETGHPYIVESGRHSVRWRSNPWTVALDEDIVRGYIDSAKLIDGRLWFTSSLVFHADFFMSAKYSELSYDRRRDKLGEDFHSRS
jgi:hypothetical protein